ncbi:cysteine desulfurase [Corynebacterium ammoniagenes DSM 20306]|jgi:hypothetical protein|nr:cysteine desulfurase [Corynebacterium ammoniagenes DSM 20306]AQS74506.1 cysteine desulfurase [Corynebacterium ammoniagenes]EFG81133.1 hypothetical protein HMPREF0281_01567 [Corynebacterium ammoniagenes DSM 20306]
MISVMNIFFNNDSENLLHDYLDLTTSSTLPQQIAQVVSHLGPGSLTAGALNRAADSWSRSVAHSTGATAEQLHSVTALLDSMREDDEGLAAHLGRLR